MKVNPSFTGSFYAQRSDVHQQLYPDESTMKAFMAHSGIDVDGIKELRITKDNIAIICADRLNGAIAQYFNRHSMQYFFDPETLTVNGIIRSAINFFKSIH